MRTLDVLKPFFNQLSDRDLGVGVPEQSGAVGIREECFILKSLPLDGAFHFGLQVDGVALIAFFGWGPVRTGFPCTAHRDTEIVSR